MTNVLGKLENQPEDIYATPQSFIFKSYNPKKAGHQINKFNDSIDPFCNNQPAFSAFGAMLD